MASVTADEMRKIAELLESSLVSPQVLNRPNEEPIAEDDYEDDNHEENDLDSRLEKMEQAAGMIRQASSLLRDAVSGSGLEERTRLYITNKLDMLSNGEDHEISIPKIMQDLERRY